MTCSLKPITGRGDDALDGHGDGVRHTAGGDGDGGRAVADGQQPAGGADGDHVRMRGNVGRLVRQVGCAVIDSATLPAGRDQQLARA